MLPTKFRFIWPSGFRDDCLEINQSETKHPWKVLYKDCSFTNVVLIRLQTWPPQTILVSDWLISKYLLLCNCLAK
jgi:hypothetical protein